jgi:hypothetical protein
MDKAHRCLSFCKEHDPVAGCMVISDNRDSWGFVTFKDNQTLSFRYLVNSSDVHNKIETLHALLIKSIHEITQKIQKMLTVSTDSSMYLSLFSFTIFSLALLQPATFSCVQPLVCEQSVQPLPFVNCANGNERDPFAGGSR